jgi:two-component system OmpR family response regulator
VWVSGDPTRLTQVVCNLLTNAAKFSSPDQAIAIDVWRVGDQAQLSVRDDGAGIPAALLPRVFDRFVQGEQALQRASGGLGLGLAIAKNLVELHGGTITAASAGAGRGACFTLSLPAVESAAIAPAAATPPRDAPARTARILIVDDNDDAAQSLALILRLEGHEVCAARDGEEAIRLLDEFVPEAAVLDIGLPKMDGISVLEAWRRNGRAMPVLMLTARDRWSDKVQGFDAGADDYVAKPFHLEEVLARVRALLRRSAGHAKSEFNCGPVRLDTRTGRVSVNGNPVKLTSHEYRLLAYLMHHTGRVVSRTELVEHLYDQDFDRDSNTIEVFVGRIRKKLGVEIIQTVRGLGYLLTPPDAR